MFSLSTTSSLHTTLGLELGPPRSRKTPDWELVSSFGWVSWVVSVLEASDGAEVEAVVIVVLKLQQS
jgi:hypothetical protein